LICLKLAFGDDVFTGYGKTLKEINFIGVRYTDIDILTRELVSQVGRPYLRENVLPDYNALDKLDVFSQIKISPVEFQDGVILEITVREIYPYLPFITYEVTDENGFSVGAGLQSVNLGRRDVFLVGLARFGGATNISMLLANPWFAGDHVSYQLEFNQRERVNELDDFQETATEITFRLGSYLGPKGRLGGFSTFQSIKSDAAGRTLSSTNRDNVSSLGFYIGYDSRDVWSNPHTGWWNEADVAKTGGFLGGSSDFWRLNVDLRRYIPVVKKQTLALFSLLTLTTGTVGKDVAAWQDFSLGGTNSVRGWELGSRTGKNQLISTAEYRVTVLEPKLLTLAGLSVDIGLQLAAFADLGMAWNQQGQFQSGNLIGGYGVGLRLLVPFVDMFRFDFGMGQHGKSVTVNIGGFTKAVAQRYRVR
jgi:outer membrane protein assembly factor BamA